MTFTRSLTLAVLVTAGAAWPANARAQAPATAPLVLTVPISARVTALGGAWVAGRDQDVIFSNPAQLVGVRTDFSASMARFGPSAHGGSLTSAYAGGKWSFTLGWGVQVLQLTAPIGALPPYSVNRLIANADNQLLRATGDVQSAVATIGGAVQYKTLKIGVATKYASDRSSSNHSAVLVDVGVSRNLLNGVAAIAVQNLGRNSLEGLPLAHLPRQIAAGWSTARPLGPLDVALFTQVTRRSDWTAAAAGLEAGYSWIEGYFVTLRAGMHRAETTAERPVTLGAAFSADRLSIDYAIRFFDDNRRAHLVTMRWR